MNRIRLPHIPPLVNNEILDDFGLTVINQKFIMGHMFSAHEPGNPEVDQPKILIDPPEEPQLQENERTPAPVRPPFFPTNPPPPPTRPERPTWVN